MVVNDNLLLNGEKIILALRGLYSEYGYAPYRMSKFEEYDLYAKNKEFLVSDSVITFTDNDGKLMALKPDVTLSIIKNVNFGAGEVKKVYYSENVYRPAGGVNSFKEIMQTGLECFGAINASDITEVIILAAESLKLLSDKCVLDLSDIGVVNAIIENLSLSGSAKKSIYRAIDGKNVHEIKAVCAENGVNAKDAEFLAELLKIGGDVKKATAELVALAAKFGKEELIFDLNSVLKTLAESAVADIIRLDFSVTGDGNYYNGIVFKGFISGVPNAVLSGGQYDNLMRKMRKNAKAIGFAVYTDAVGEADFSAANNAGDNGDGFLNIALPKGRLGEKVYALFAGAGYECPSLLEPNRKLIFENAANKVRYFWVKPSDVAIYVERGAADIGVAGKDILLEYSPDVYELLDLKAGKCKMAVAAKKDFSYDKSNTLRVATKFANIAKEFYRSKGRNIDVIKLNGSIEIAPILGLSDVIVDIVETGETLKENDLSVVETIVPVSARLIANKAASKFKENAVKRLVEKMTETVNGL